ncbi:hypothetical protein SSCG_01513 [Streptomyces clavuligerus]|nr:hypothetical protein SSCG_01513 [Streptomyces clavuligerus]
MVLAVLGDVDGRAVHAGALDDPADGVGEGPVGVDGEEDGEGGVEGLELVDELGDGQRLGQGGLLSGLAGVVSSGCGRR